MCCPLDPIKTGSNSVTPSCLDAPTATRAVLHGRISCYPCHFCRSSLGGGETLLHKVNQYSELKQLLRYNAPAPCACALISPHHHQARVLPKAAHLRLYHEWNAAITGPAERRTLRDRPARLMHLPCERWEGDWIRLSCQPHLTDGLVPAWPPQAPNQLFASHSTPSTTWGTFSLPTMTIVLALILQALQRHGRVPCLRQASKLTPVLPTDDWR